MFASASGIICARLLRAVLVSGLAPSGARLRLPSPLPVRIIKAGLRRAGPRTSWRASSARSWQDAIGQPVVVEKQVTGAGGKYLAPTWSPRPRRMATIPAADRREHLGSFPPNLLASAILQPRSKDLRADRLDPVRALTRRRASEPAGQDDHPRAGGACEGQRRQGAVRYNAGIGGQPITSPPCSWRRTGAWAFKHVPYRGGADAIKGTVCGREPGDPQRRDARPAPFVAQGQLRGLAVSGDRRRVDSIVRSAPASASSTSARPASAPGRDCSRPPERRAPMLQQRPQHRAQQDSRHAGEITKAIENLGGEVSRPARPRISRSGSRATRRGYAAIIMEAGIIGGPEHAPEKPAPDLIQVGTVFRRDHAQTKKCSRSGAEHFAGKSGHLGFPCRKCNQKRVFRAVRVDVKELAFRACLPDRFGAGRLRRQIQASLQHRDRRGHGAPGLRPPRARWRGSFWASARSF